MSEPIKVGFGAYSIAGKFDLWQTDTLDLENPKQVEAVSKQLADMTGKMLLTQDELVAVFKRWNEKGRNDPTLFDDLATYNAEHTPTTYGQECGVYFTELLNEVRKQ